MNPYQALPGNSRSANRKSMAGISLVETMVGLTLGLIVTLVITQVWGVFENQRSRTSSGSTAQENGLMALTQLEQTIRNAGSGINAGLFQCGQIFSTYDDGTTVSTPAPGIPSSAPAPVEITDGGATGSDTIRITMSKDIAGAIESSVTKQDPQQNAVINLNNVQHFSEVPNPCSATDKLEHLAVCRHGNQCVVMQVTSILEASLKLNANKGSCGPYNPTATCYNAGGACATWPIITTNDTCFSIGSFVVNTYSVNANNQLQVVTSSGPTATTTILADNIVSLQAQYGVAQTGSQNADCWTNATAAGNAAVSNCGISWVAGALTGAQISRIKAVRLVAIARSPKPEGTDVTSTCANNAGTNNGPCAWQDSATNKAPLINLSSTANWQRYRYRSYQTIIPLRNVIWAGV
ncbi:MAG: PilW family protein [Dechloromonas sp.]|nr:PilW family protein [Dechloromonas sp.]